MDSKRSTHSGRKPLLIWRFGIAGSKSIFTHIYQAEFFHTANRSTAIGLPYAASHLVGALLPLGALTLLSAIGSVASTPAAHCCCVHWPSPSEYSGRAPTAGS